MFVPYDPRPYCLAIYGARHVTLYGSNCAASRDVVTLHAYAWVMIETNVFEIYI